MIYQRHLDVYFPASRTRLATVENSYGRGLRDWLPPTTVCNLPIWRRERAELQKRAAAAAAGVARFREMLPRLRRVLPEIAYTLHRIEGALLFLLLTLFYRGRALH